jgi:hypothetical protein
MGTGIMLKDRTLKRYLEMKLTTPSSEAQSRKRYAVIRSNGYPLELPGGRSAAISYMMCVHLEHDIL